MVSLKREVYRANVNLLQIDENNRNHIIAELLIPEEEVPEIALTLAKAFWPGPLTMILKAKPGIYAPALSAGLPTVSFRMPNHPVTLELITKVGIPLVGPSANLSTKPSPTKVEHVFEDMNGRIRVAHPSELLNR